MATPYPRDLVGYGRRPPHPRWPNAARIAVQFVLNHEEGAENSVLDGDPASETFLSEITSAQALPMQIQLRTRVMPIGNLTQMTEDERTTVLAWLDDGARH